VAKIRADDGKIMFFRIDALDSADFFHGTGLVDVTAESIDRIGRINDDSPVTEHLHHLLNSPWIRVFFIQSDKFCHG